MKARNVLRSIDCVGHSAYKKYSLSSLARMDAIPRFVVKKGGCYMVIASSKLKFVDNKLSCRGNIGNEIVQLVQRVKPKGNVSLPVV